MKNIPKEMSALQIDQYHEYLSEAIRSLHVVKKPVPSPNRAQVLIKVAASPCNPSDLLLLQGRYGKRKTLPTVPGWEGAGTVVASGGGIFSRWLLGKRVAFSNQSDRDGSWGEYCVADAKACIALKDGLSFEQGACLIINPITALGLIDSAIKGKHPAIIQTAAASQVGKMVLKLSNDKGIPSIHIVRRKSQVDLLKKMGASIVLNSESENFIQDLKTHASKLNASVAFDAIGGDMTGSLLSAMPKGSEVLVYGALSGANCSNISPLSLIFQEKKVLGFYLSKWIEDQSLLGLYKATNLIQRMFASGSFQTDISANVKLEDASKALEAYQREMTAGKVLIKP